MKRTLSFVALALFVVGSSASAQTARIDTVDQGLKFVAVCSGLKGVVYDAGVNIGNTAINETVSLESCPMDSDNSAKEAQEFLSADYTASVQDGSLHVARAQAPQQVPPTLAARPTSGSLAGIPPMMLHMYNVPPEYSPSLGISEADWVLARNRTPPQRQFSPTFTSYYDEYGWDSGYWDNSYGHDIWVPAWYKERQRVFRLRGMNGGVKTTGDTRGVLIFARGCFIADAQEIDGAFDQKAPVPTGDHLTFTAVRIKDWQAYDVPVRPASQAENEVVGARHLTLRIHKQMFDHGRSFDAAAAQRQCEASKR